MQPTDDNVAVDRRREISQDEAIAIVIDYMQRDELAGAEAMCRGILEVVPEQADALHYLGILAHRRGRSAEGVALIRRSLDLVPDQADWHSNLGIVLQAVDDLDGAIGSFQRAIVLRPDHPNAHSNLGVLLRVFRRHDEAEAEYRRAIELNPNHANAYHNLAILLDIMGRPAEAVDAYSRALTLKPVFPQARRLLALAYCAIGDREKAIRVCEHWVAEEPDDPVARHSLAAVSERGVPARAADDYVRASFDTFAETFEAKLARLHYRAPELVVESVGASGLISDRSHDVLDAGCGTGLCGPLLAPYARRLIGVDLSGGMLKHASAKQVYDALHESELTAFIAAHREAFDLIVSADTLVYFGALEPVSAAAAAALRPGGCLVFTVEEWVDAPEASTYRIRPHGRYNHAADYIRRVLAAEGLRVHLDRGELRAEQGVPVDGLIVRATKPAAPRAGTAWNLADGDQHG